MPEPVKLVSMPLSPPKEDAAPTRFKQGMAVCLNGDFNRDVIMTVRSATKTKVVCDWMDADKTLCGADFAPSMLSEVEIADPEKTDESD